MRLQVKLSGFGGQGIILSGYIVGKAAALYDGKFATHTQSYGPEARGGACAAEVIISDDKPTDYPFVTDADILVTMSQEAFETYKPLLQRNGTLIYDKDLVHIHDVPKTVKKHSIPATKIAENLGNKIVANVVMLGFFARVTGAVSKNAMVRCIRESVPSRFLDLNMRAFEEGWQWPENSRRRRRKSGAA